MSLRLEKVRKFRVPVRLNEEEKIFLAKAAEEAGKSQAEYMRFLIRKKRHPRVIDQEVVNLARELHKIGVNLNQLTKFVHQHNAIDSENFNALVANLDELRLRIVRRIAAEE